MSLLMLLEVWVMGGGAAAVVAPATVLLPLGRTGDVCKA